MGTKQKSYCDLMDPAGFRSTERWRRCATWILKYGDLRHASGTGGHPRTMCCEVRLLSLRARENRTRPLFFSDESRFGLSPDNSWIYIKRGAWSEASTVKKTKFPKDVTFFGAIGVGFKSKLVRCTGMVDTTEYIQLVRDSGVIEKMSGKYGKFKWLFMQDGTPAMSILGREVNFMAGWPPNSCDLNPIEVLWVIVKKRARQDFADLPFAEAVVAAWHSISQSTIGSLVKGFRHRWEMCVANRGKSISQNLSSGGEPQQASEPPPDFALTPDVDALLRDLHAKHGTR